MKNKYKQIGKNDIDNVERCFFENCGVKNPNEYKTLNESYVIPYQNLNNIEKAARIFIENVHRRVHIVVDCDADGVTSAAMIYRYINEAYGNKPTYSLHAGKQHGLSDDIKIPEDTELLIIPDAGTNDVKQCKELSEKGVNIIVLDHHLKEVDNPYAVIVNNQTSENYSNKEFCGAGIVYKFLKAVDELEWIDKADEFLDLVALGNISDVMDMRSYETRYLTQNGLENIKSKAFKAMLKAQQNSIHTVNINAIAFYISPLINAVCRVGTEEDKEMLFRAFADEYEEFDYCPRKSEEATIENIYDRAARLAKNAKSRQTKAIDKITSELKAQVERLGKQNYPVMFVKANEKISGDFTGLVSMKLADNYKKPCLVLRKDGEMYRGSARNFDNSPIDNLKKVIQSTDLFDTCAGHENAFGVTIVPENVVTALNQITENLKDLNWEIPVDFSLTDDELGIEFIRDVDDLNGYFGTGLKEPTVLVKSVRLIKSQCQIMGKNEDTWKFIRDDNVQYIKFRNSADDKVLNWIKSDSDNDLAITVFGKVRFNAFDGLLTPQVTIGEYEVEETV